MLVDPTTSVCYEYEEEAAALEVADPVEQNAYRLDGVWVSDFTLPSYFAGATLGVCTVEAAGGQECTINPVGDPNPPALAFTPTPLLIAPAAAPGPYDHMGMLSAPWSGQTDDGS